jgi:hypothetical protein
MKKIISLVLIISIAGILEAEAGIINPTLAQLRHQRERINFTASMFGISIGGIICASIFAYKLLQHIKSEEEKLGIKSKKH